MKIVVFLAAVAMLSGCASGRSRNGTGLIYTEVSDSVVATSNVGSSKTGQSCATNVLALVSTGDMSIETAKKIGNITKVASVDYTQKSILGIYDTTCVIVRGE